ncbi:TetR/AcrR family transcriptional regulator [Nonomuraea angiospora]|uniref:AcrR family transcriptional regulator n=1 Tax=Nonomuraea angiospora TaxID=46172 RepID=A0ABR9MLQ0_9ACTN|nr:TetR/AcrR family transcriptional regulator [Nonomuraea angiospora]MBE1593367.1 AcrR family transcriptional regulator [Nonomuraea angiospora]
MTADSPDSPRAPHGLRERKKWRARRAIREAALQLFAEHGYESVTVEQIAAAAEVSRATFFNYFAGKEATITEPDPDEIAAWAEIRARRPADEPLWPALTAVIIESFRSSERSLAAQKRIKAASPDLAGTFIRSSQWIARDLREWVDQRTPAEQRPWARLQLNVAMAALVTAYEEWQADQPFEQFVETAHAYLQRLADGVHPSGR